jgi:hypothetical protein
MGKAVLALMAVLLATACRKQNLPFSDNFERYAESEYPAAGGWYQLWSGVSACVTSAAAHSGKKSFRLIGDPHWVRADGVRLNLKGVDALVYEFAVMVPAGSDNGALAGFFRRTGVSENHDDNAIVFDNQKQRVVVKGRAWLDTEFAWQPGRWYSVRVELDYARGAMNAWVNDTLVAAQLPAAGAGASDVFELSSEWRPNEGTVTAYFDDVVIYAPKQPMAATADSGACDRR